MCVCETSLCLCSYLITKYHSGSYFAIYSKNKNDIKINQANKTNILILLLMKNFYAFSPPSISLSSVKNCLCVSSVVDRSVGLGDKRVALTLVSSFSLFRDSL